MSFSPAILEVRFGVPIEFRNADLVPHTATTTKPMGAFESGPLQPGATWRFTPQNPGPLSYACGYHLAMKGEVIVPEQNTK